MFQHTAARRRLVKLPILANKLSKFQHTAARRRLGYYKYRKLSDDSVSTHSRPKAAGPAFTGTAGQHSSFNTQPPEGGWGYFFACADTGDSFNTQPPEGGWRLA